MSHDPIEQVIAEVGEEPPINAMFKTDAASLIKLFAGLTLLIAAWVRMESKTDVIAVRQERIEQTLSSYIPREVQALHDQLVFDKLDAMRDELKRLSQRIDSK